MPSSLVSGFGSGPALTFQPSWRQSIIGIISANSAKSWSQPSDPQFHETTMCPQNVVDVGRYKDAISGVYVSPGMPSTQALVR